MTSSPEGTQLWWKKGPEGGPHDTVSVCAKAEPSTIGFLNALVDAHDHIACLRTVDPKAGLLEFWVAPDCLEDFWEMMKGLRNVADVEIEER